MTCGSRTLYLAETRECAYAEVLAYFRRRLGQADVLAKDARFLGLDPASLSALVEHEWSRRGHLPPGYLPAGWRAERSLYQIRLPSSGWWVQLEHPESIAVAEVALEDDLASVGVNQLDVAVLRGQNRDATVLLASWLCGLTLDDDTTPLGIRYESRHATGIAWACWLREPTTGSAYVGAEACAGEPIEINDPDFQRVATRAGLTIC